MDKHISPKMSEFQDRMFFQVRLEEGKGGEGSRKGGKGRGREQDGRGKGDPLEEVDMSYFDKCDT